MQKTAEKTHMIDMETAYLRDDFYRDGFRVILLSLGAIVVAISLLVILSLYFFLHQVLPVSLPVYSDWRVQTDVPVGQPYLHTADLLQWVSAAVPSMFDYNFMNYMKNSKNISRYFTANGLLKYGDMVNVFINHDDVLKSKLFVTATAAGAPFVLNKGVIEGKYAWWVQMPVDVLYSGVEGSNHTVKLEVQLLVVRISTWNDLDGVSIENMIVTRI